MKLSEKWANRLYNAIFIGLFITLALNIWTDFEKIKLNQHYEQLIEQRADLNKRYEKQIIQGTKINDDLSKMIIRYQNVLDIVTSR